jgi:hypothetical protein
LQILNPFVASVAGSENCRRFIEARRTVRDDHRAGRSCGREGTGLRALEAAASPLNAFFWGMGPA